jgi:preprotein translocase subunit SecG
LYTILSTLVWENREEGGGILHTFVTIIHVLIALGLIASVVLQSGKSAGLSGAIAGGAESIFGKKKGLDELLAKVTAGLAFSFLATSLYLALVK